MLKTNLKIIESDLGSVRHCLRKDDPGYKSFGEVYFSTVKKDVIKAWKLHKKMTMNISVQNGSVLFCFKDNRVKSQTFNDLYKVILNKQSYSRITVPPNIWFGFKGLSDSCNLVCNVSDIIHDDSEVIKTKINAIEFNWNKFS